MKMLRSRRSVLFLFLVLAHTCQAIYELRQTLTATSEIKDLGRSVALDIESGYMVLGSLSKLVQIYNYGRDDTWVLYQQFASTAVQDDKFGWSVAMGGRFIAVGAPFALNPEGTATGAVYIYRRTVRGHKWELVQTLYGDEVFGVEFGHAVSMNDQNLIISDRRHKEVADNAGIAYVFRRADKSETYTLQNKLVPDDLANGDLFGYSVAIHGVYAAVGAIGDDDGSALSTGSAYIFQNKGNSWDFLMKVMAPVSESLKNFGESVAIYQNTIAIGALRHGGTLNNEGAIYVYDRQNGSFTLTAELLAQNPGINDQLGRSVAIRDQTVVAGAWKDDVGTSNILDAGSAYVFVKKNSGWAYEEQLLADPPATLDEYGGSVALGCDGTLLVGAPNRFAGQGVVAIYRDSRVNKFQRWQCTRLRLLRRRRNNN